MVAETKKTGKDHASVAEIYNNNIQGRCTQINEDISRIYRKVGKVIDTIDVITYYYLNP